MKDHLVVVDAPETEARSLGVIEAVKRAIPGKPIRYLINTASPLRSLGRRADLRRRGRDHHHATRATSRSNENMWRNPRTVMPDRLAKSGRTPVFEGVTGTRMLNDGSRESTSTITAGNMHNAGMLMVYPAARADADRGGFMDTAGPRRRCPGGVANLVHFYEAVQRLQLDVDQVVPIHGRLTTFRRSEASGADARQDPVVDQLKPLRGVTMANLTGTQASDWRSDGSLAYGLFRFTFGVNIMMRASSALRWGFPRSRPTCSRSSRTCR